MDKPIKKLRTTYKSEKVCTYFPNCRYGDKCKFRHIESISEQIIQDKIDKKMDNDNTGERSIEEIIEILKPIGYSGKWA